jgi:hypothetical protein
MPGLTCLSIRTRLDIGISFYTGMTKYSIWKYNLETVTSSINASLDSPLPKHYAFF